MYGNTALLTYACTTAYKIRWEVRIPVHLLEGRTHQQRATNRKSSSTTREPTQMEERATLQHPDKEIKEAMPLNPIELLP